MAWPGENSRVTLIRMPSATSRFPASRPSGVMGTFTTAFGPIWARCSPCLYIGSASGSVVSRDTSPSTSARISFHRASGSSCSLLTREGLVVMPDSTPHRLISRISSRFAVSRNSLMCTFLSEGRANALPVTRCGSGNALGHLLHHQVDDGCQNLVEVVVWDDRHPVGQRLAFDIALDLADLVEPIHVLCRRPPGMVRRPGLEVVAVHGLVLHRHDDRHGHDPAGSRIEVDEPRHHVGTLDDHAHAFHSCPFEQGIDTADTCSRNPTATASLVGGSRSASPASNDDL